jgi:ATP-dependent exoDNAse (exonuclease V) alpha subunit
MAQHLSIRVPWKDNGYSGLVCDKPCYNNACLRLKNISDSRDDAYEEALKGCPIAGHEKEIPCVSEGGVFMSATTHAQINIHPYKELNPETHGHFRETELVYPPYSLPSRPFAWMMLRKGKDRDDQNIRRLADRYNIDYDPAREPKLRFATNWIQDAVNQRAIFKTFYENVKPNQSLVIPYCKQVPFIDDSKRVVMGIGFVKNIIEPPEHEHTADGTLRSILWETMIGHSIRNDRKDGFLLPYQEMMEYAEAHPDFDISAVTVFADDEYFEEFSYATEHLSYDAVISVLLQTLKVLDIIKNCIPGNWQECIEWTNARLNEVWIDRGAFPGLGAMLCAIGFKFGVVIANEIKNSISKDDSFEEYVSKVLKKPKDFFNTDIAASIGKTEQGAFLSLSGDRKTLFWLLARMSLSVEQANVLFNTEYRQKAKVCCSDREIIENPYLLYERTRTCADEVKVAVRKVDMAVFPPKELRDTYPLYAPSVLDSENDERRIRAIAISVLEQQSLNGHTVYPQSKLIIDMNELPIEPGCHVSIDVFNSINEFLSHELTSVECADGAIAYQLSGLTEVDDVIRKAVSKRVNAKRHIISEDWKKLVDTAFGADQNNETEKRAREEKAAILQELAEARLSVLVGGAGTGKTTLLSLLCKSPQIRDGGVLLLAPTGKARVRMWQAMQKQGVSSNAKTVAQFLMPNSRFDYNTTRYQLSDEEAKDVPFTVIIDECSMLTEEMFGALIQALRKAQRIIFVGDPNQLPPIGAGRPFVDLVRYLKKDIPAFPRVGKSYGELTVTRRQENADGDARTDTALAEWYTDTTAELDDEIFVRLQGNNCGKDITFKTWSTPEELEDLILQTIAEEVGMKDVDDINGFNISLGGTAGQYNYFNLGCADKSESWQVLAPIRGLPHGVANINHIIHGKYRANYTALAKESNFWQRRIPRPFGAEGIVYGDKVINVINTKRKAYPDNASAIHYVANGEIGVAFSNWVKKDDSAKVRKMKLSGLKVEFSSQQGFSYQYDSRDFGEETDAALELAYALTVHKAQGSEFSKVILVISEPCGLLSKELLYTAITRQTERLVILYNSEAYHLRNYASKAFSDVARRFTCLFEKPEIIEFKERLYEASLIHKTLKGELVRSKSELIIANMLYEAGIPYEYEKELSLGKDGIRIPDFTIDDAESGMLFYWEHCGMMSDRHYRQRWEEKKAVYAKHGIIEGENLIVSYDDMNGGIDSIAIKALIERYLK